MPCRGPSGAPSARSANTLPCHSEAFSWRCSPFARSLSRCPAWVLKTASRELSKDSPVWVRIALAWRAKTSSAIWATVWSGSMVRSLSVLLCPLPFWGTHSDSDSGSRVLAKPNPNPPGGGKRRTRIRSLALSITYRNTIVCVGEYIVSYDTDFL